MNNDNDDHEEEDKEEKVENYDNDNHHDDERLRFRFLVYRVQRTICSHSWTTMR
jgi:hypothetical protein